MLIHVDVNADLKIRLIKLKTLDSSICSISILIIIIRIIFSMQNQFCILVAQLWEIELNQRLHGIDRLLNCSFKYWNEICFIVNNNSDTIIHHHHHRYYHRFILFLSFFFHISRRLIHECVYNIVRTQIHCWARDSKLNCSDRLPNINIQ